MKIGISICVVLSLLIVLNSCQKEDEFELFTPNLVVNVLLPSEGLGDRSFIDVVYKGVEEATKDFNFSVNYIIPESLEKGEEWIKNIPRLPGNAESASMIIIAGSQFVKAVNTLNGNYGGHKVLLLAGTTEQYAGMASIVYRSYAPSYIGGYLSAKLVPGCRATVIAAFDASFLTEYQSGFKQGVIDAGGTVSPTQFLSSGFEGFDMSDSAYSLTESLLPSHDLIFALATGSNLGIINAARNYKQKRYVIGVDADQSWMGLTVVTGSVVALFEIDIYEYISRYSEGMFKLGSFTMSMEDRKNEFLINKIVLGSAAIPQSLIDTAVKKEKEYSK
ncbi:MAG: BMP family ABC transporter substrate-binding protein [Mangrovibacterium sp.]|nr:BMP family ABC transporter substrate-binding protein [Mangrovibacterium sp.]